MTYFNVCIHRTFIINAKSEAEAIALAKGRVMDDPWSLFARCLVEGDSDNEI